MVISYAVTDIAGQKPKTWSPTSPQRMQISLIDISRAYFNAPTDPLKPSYVSLPVEAGAPDGTCALLKKHMYGTQKAADGWQSEYSGALIAMVLPKALRQLACFRTLNGASSLAYTATILRRAEGFFGLVSEENARSL